MECLIQYLDELEDFCYTIALLAERIRRAIRSLLLFALSATLPAGGILLAVTHPPLGLATAFLALSGLLYNAVVGLPPRTTQN